MKFGIVVFPGSWSERDMRYAVADGLGYEAEYVWHRQTSVKDFDAILLPGGFSYGDHLRCGAIAAHSPVMGAIKGFANDGGFVFGSCNGFQILCESGLLPGALIRNKSSRVPMLTGNLAGRIRSDTLHISICGRRCCFDADFAR